MGSFFSAPKVQSSASADLDAARKKSKLVRKSLFATKGGEAGEELTPSQVGKRDSFFGN